MDILSLLKSLQGGQQSSTNPLAQLFGFQEEDPIGTNGGPRFGGGSQGNPPNVLSLRGSQGEQEPVMGEGNVDPRTIEVAAAAPRMSRGDPTATEEEPLQLGNAALLLEAQAAGENAPERKRGYFGTKGTLRNILGTLSDAFLVQGGADAQYAPLRERERLADAMTGYTQNPQAAAERMAYQGFGDQSTKVWNDSQNREINQGTLAAKQEEIARKALEDGDQRYKQYATLFSQYAGSADAETWPRAKEILKTLKQRGGLGEEFVIPEEYDPRLMRTYQFGGMPATNQVRSVDKNEDQAWDREKFGRAEAGRMARDNPPAARQPRSQTDLEYFKEVGNIPEARRTQAQKDFYKKYTQGTGRGSGRGTTSTRRQVTPPGTFKGWTSAPRQ